MAVCRSCKATIEFVTTAAGKQMPCDPTVVSVVTATGDVVRGRVPHWATCPTASQHRGKK
jgi:hypothetical protein